ncbi:MAG: hypothetical protein [Microviridae sp.]|nr:MAG: hypothetical protein [Microviridae sp.]
MKQINERSGPQTDSRGKETKCERKATMIVIWNKCVALENGDNVDPETGEIFTKEIKPNKEYWEADLKVIARQKKIQFNEEI